MCPVCKETGRRWGELQSFLSLLSWAVPAALWCRTCFWTTAVLGAEIKIVLFCMPSANHGNLFHILGSIILELPRSLSLEESMRYYKLWFVLREMGWANLDILQGIWYQWASLPACGRSQVKPHSTWDVCVPPSAVKILVLAVGYCPGRRIFMYLFSCL